MTIHAWQAKISVGNILTEQCLDWTPANKYRTKFQDYEDGTQYLFLAVGFDDTFTGTTENPIFQNTNSVAAYGQPENIATVGKKLSEEYFRLQDGADVSLIAQSELFAGSETFTRQQLKDGTALSRPIILYRRVAGVMGYFKQLPAEIDGRKVAHVKLRLYTPQNKDIYFLPHLPAGYDNPDMFPTVNTLTTSHQAAAMMQNV